MATCPSEYIRHWFVAECIETRDRVVRYAKGENGFRPETGAIVPDSIVAGPERYVVIEVLDDQSSAMVDGMYTFARSLGKSSEALGTLEALVSAGR